jgi:aarF domain-containing kinase
MRIEDQGGDELFNVLPKDSEHDPAGERLAELLRQTGSRKMPTSSFLRMCILGSLQAKVALGYFGYWLRSCFAGADERQKLRSEAHLAAAMQLLGTMGYLRGAVMKVGQLLANLPEVMPEEFADVLSALHFEAPPMHFAMVREVFLDELGREPEEVFASFEQQAFAAASLGQVHRARLHSGEEVAVKIQYPGIARTIKADLRNLRLLLQLLCPGKDWQDTLDKLADIERMLLMETDYVQEAAFVREAGRHFADEDMIVVPRVFDAFCTARILTTEYLEGCHLGEYLVSHPGQTERDHFTALMVMATFRFYYRLHWFLADPHPGNFIFMSGGRLGLIDFGCTKVMNDEEWRTSRGAEQAALNRDDEQLNMITAQACRFDSPGQMEPERLATVRRGVDWQLEPWLKEGLFDFGDRDFFRRGVDSIVEMARKRYTSGEPLYIWSNRFTVGGRAFCLRLKGRCEFKKIHQQEAAWCEQGMKGE